MSQWLSSFTLFGFHLRHPWALVLVFVPLLWLLWQVLRGADAKGRLAHPLVHLNITQGSLRLLLSNILPAVLYTIAWILLVIALARPVEINRTAVPPAQGVDILLVMDVSASMQNKDFEPNRFAASQRTASQFIQKRPSDRIGLVAFAKEAMLQAPLTLDHEALQSYIAAMYLGMLEANYTAIGDGLAVAANHLKTSKAKSKVIILLTDGDSNAGTITPQMAAKAAAAYGIRVYTIGAASSPGQNAYSSKEDEINEALLLEIAQTTGGQFYRAKNTQELEQIYNKINELEKTSFTPPAITYRADHFAGFLWAALAVLLAAVVAEKLLLIRMP